MPLPPPVTSAALGTDSAGMSMPVIYGPPNRVVEVLLQDFADIRPRQCVAQLHLGKALHLAEPRVGPRQDLAGIDSRAVPRDHQSERRFAPPVAGHRDDGRF